MRIYLVKYLKTADEDIEALFTFIAEASGYNLNAQKYIDRILSLCQKLSTMPQRGIKRPEFGENVRSIGFEKRVLILYRIDEDIVKVMRILYGGRDY